MRLSTVFLASLLALHSGWTLATPPAPAGSPVAEAGQPGKREAQDLYALGVAYADGNKVHRNDHRAADMFREAASRGHSSAQLRLGLLYDEGLGVGQDKGEALRWYRLAAAQGESAAQFNLGLAYRYGEGVAQDDAQSYAWFRKSAEQGDADAQNLVGEALEEGQDRKSVV